MKSIHQLDSQSPLHIISPVIHKDEQNAVIRLCGQNTLNIHKNTIRYPKQSDRKKKQSCTRFNRWFCVCEVTCDQNKDQYSNVRARNTPQMTANFSFFFITHMRHAFSFTRPSIFIKRSGIFWVADNTIYIVIRSK